MKWYLNVLKNYAKFEGRARRKEYWMFFLFDSLVRIAIALVGGVIGGLIGGTIEGFFAGIVLGFYLGAVIYSLAVLIPTLAVSVRRLHDTGKSGLWMLLSLGFIIPLLNIILGLVLTVFYCFDSEEKENQYGPNPKADLKSID
ncbi:DUF805 domain-containing protein [Bacillus sp. WMMC1349]|uniref:DUF805 domain-containing protein n=1 Tax=Bacillus sp. WMMC1349 TaxID=2736254 RepID=UPI001555F690|nr:DUF805 domain-containing protein [Bacillus sp. WMMC1349]NPC92020.1 DUF805 domain-containing protein [Bacillus sp. WMMC1349]